jgi:hypothetical protein
VDVIIGQTLVNHIYRHEAKVAEIIDVAPFTVLVLAENGKRSTIQFDSEELEILKQGRRVFGWRIKEAQRGT